VRQDIQDKEAVRLSQLRKRSLLLLLKELKILKEEENLYLEDIIIFLKNLAVALITQFKLNP
jgi:hypothetical protein